MNQDHPISESEDIQQIHSQGESATQPTQEEADQLRAELEELKTDMLRQRADLENQRKRLVRDVEQARRFANEKLLSELLPVFDSLDSGLQAVSDESNPLREGLDLTYKQLLKVAADNGLSVVDPQGQPFNPDHHQAISQIAANGIPHGHVAQVFQKGYILNERLLRPALVAVVQDD